MRTAHKSRARIPTTGGDGFTLIEIMMVVGILGMVLAMGMPAFIQSIRKDPLRQSVSDLETACSKAREAAILRGSPVELVIRAEGGQLTVIPTRDDNARRTAANEEALEQPSESADKAASQSPVFSGRFNENVAVTLLYVNLKDQMEADVSRSLGAARSLQQKFPDISALVADLMLTNKVEEGTGGGDFGDLFPGYTWTGYTNQIATNGLFQIDFVIQSRRGRQLVEWTNSIYLWRPDSKVSNFGRRL